MVNLGNIFTAACQFVISMMVCNAGSSKDFHTRKQSCINVRFCKSLAALVSSFMVSPFISSSYVCRYHPKLLLSFEMFKFKRCMILSSVRQPVSSFDSLCHLLNVLGFWLFSSRPSSMWPGLLSGDWKEEDHLLFSSLW